jgi:hypothetical protein
LSIALGEAILLDDHRVQPPYVDAGSFDLSSASSCNFPLSIRGIGIDRKLRWTGFGQYRKFEPLAGAACLRSLTIFVVGHDF